MAATLRLDKSKFFKFWFHMLVLYLFDMRRFHDFFDRSVIIRKLKNHRSRVFLYLGKITKICQNEVFVDFLSEAASAHQLCKWKAVGSGPSQPLKTLSTFASLGPSGPKTQTGRRK